MRRQGAFELDDHGIRQAALSDVHDGLERVPAALQMSSFAGRQ